MRIAILEDDPDQLALLRRWITDDGHDVHAYVSGREAMERELIREYEQTVELLLAGLAVQNHAAAVQIASLPEEIRGFGHIKKRNVEAARKKRHELLQRFNAQGAERAAA